MTDFFNFIFVIWIYGVSIRFCGQVSSMLYHMFRRLPRPVKWAWELLPDAALWPLWLWCDARRKLAREKND